MCGSGKWLIRRAGVRGQAGRAGYQRRPGVPSRARFFLAGSVGCELPVDGVGQAPPQAAHRFPRGFPGGALAPVVGPACGVVAQLDDPGDVKNVAGRRFPARESRWRMCWPLEASIGAVPVQDAK